MSDRLPGVDFNVHGKDGAVSGKAEGSSMMYIIIALVALIVCCCCSISSSISSGLGFNMSKKNE